MPLTRRTRFAIIVANVFLYAVLTLLASAETEMLYGGISIDPAPTPISEMVADGINFPAAFVGEVVFHALHVSSRVEHELGFEIMECLVAIQWFVLTSITQRPRRESGSIADIKKFVFWLAVIFTSYLLLSYEMWGVMSLTLTRFWMIDRFAGGRAKFLELSTFWLVFGLFAATLSWVRRSRA